MAATKNTAQRNHKQLVKVVQPCIALTGIFKPLPARCKLFQSFYFRSTHVDPLPCESTSPTPALPGSPYAGSLKISNAIALDNCPSPLTTSGPMRYPDV